MPPPFVPPRYETKACRYQGCEEAMADFPAQAEDGWAVRQMLGCLCTMIRESQRLHPDVIVIYEREK
jgi:hypothetical protein